MAKRHHKGNSFKYILIWGIALVALVGAKGVWDDLNPVTPAQKIQGFNNDIISASKYPDGHFRLILEVNDVPVEFLVDTGATEIVLTKEDARRVGLDVSQLSFWGEASTANGEVRTAPVRLGKIALGNIHHYGVTALVNNASMEKSLLGMSYLSRLSSIEIQGDQIILRQ